MVEADKSAQRQRKEHRLRAVRKSYRRRTGAQFLVFLGTALLAGLSMPALAQTSSGRPTSGDNQRAEREQQLIKRRSELTEAESRAVAVSHELEQLNKERGEVKSQLVDTASAVQRAESKLSEIEERLAGLTASEDRQREALAVRHGELSKLLSAMQRMGRNPPPVIVTERQDVLTMIRSAKLLARVLPQLNEKASALSTELRKLEAVTKEVRSERDSLRAETTKYNQSRTRLAALLDTNQKLAQQRERELEDVRRQSDTIRQSVTEIDELIRRHDQLISKQQEIAAYEAELKIQKNVEAQRAAEALNPAGTAASAPPAVFPPPPVPGPGPAAAPSQQQVAMNVPRPPAENHIRSTILAPQDGRPISNPGRMKPEIAFHRAKGKLPIPASGRHVIRFGEPTHLGTKSPGLAISTRPGAQVTSPADGWVLFASTFRSFGQLLIINAGDNYHILLTGLSRIDVQVGQFVLAAEPVGTMSTVVNTNADGANEGPVLYVEFRKDGKPIDPSPWWVSGQQKVQG